MKPQRPLTPVIKPAVQRAFQYPPNQRRPDPLSFIRMPTHEAYFRIADSWLSASEPHMIICGAANAGKTHFASVFAPTAPIVDALNGPSDLTAFNENLIILDRAEASQPERLFRFLENSKGVRLMLVGRGAPADWAHGVPALRTRLEAMPRIVFSDPDEALMRAIIVRGFRERQIDVNENVAAYAAPRLPRTFAAAHKFVEDADQLSLETKQKISVALVRQLVDNLSEGLNRA